MTYPQRDEGEDESDGAVDGDEQLTNPVCISDTQLDAERRETAVVALELRSSSCVALWHRMRRDDYELADAVDMQIQPQPLADAGVDRGSVASQQQSADVSIGVTAVRQLFATHAAPSDSARVAGGRAVGSQRVARHAVSRVR